VKDVLPELARWVASPEYAAITLYGLPGVSVKWTVQLATPVPAGASVHVDPGGVNTTFLIVKLTVPVGVVGEGLRSVTVAVQLPLPEPLVHETAVVVDRETTSVVLPLLAKWSMSPGYVAVIE
jgi:hypothetical protein